MPDTQDRMQHTILAHSLREFIKEAPRIGACFRCLVPVDPNSDDWATFARIDEKVDQQFAVGGVLCAACVADWNRWKRGSANPPTD